MVNHYEIYEIKSLPIKDAVILAKKTLSKDVPITKEYVSKMHSKVLNNEYLVVLNLHKRLQYYLFNELNDNISAETVNVYFDKLVKYLHLLDKEKLNRRSIIACDSVRGQVQTLYLHNQIESYKPHRNSLGFQLHGVVI